MMHIRSVRFRLLAAANTAIVLLLGVFLILDYRQEIVGRVAEKGAVPAAICFGNARTKVAGAVKREIIERLRRHGIDPP